MKAHGLANILLVNSHSSADLENENAAQSRFQVLWLTEELRKRCSRIGGITEEISFLISVELCRVGEKVNNE